MRQREEIKRPVKAFETGGRRARVGLEEGLIVVSPSCKNPLI